MTAPAPDRFRDTSRVGPCLYCGRSTVRECTACARFVCMACEERHPPGCSR